MIESADHMRVVFQARVRYQDTMTTSLRTPTAYPLSWRSLRLLPDYQAQHIRVSKPALPSDHHWALRSRIRLQEA